MVINAVITGDLVKSGRIEGSDFSIVLNSLKVTFDEINNQLLDGEGAFEIFRGDSFQGLIPKPEMALLIAIIIRSRLRTYEPSFSLSGSPKKGKTILYAYSDARVAIGIGKISHQASKITESQGEAFEFSGKLLDKLTKDGERLGINTPWTSVNQELEVQCKLADALISRWTPSTAEAMYHLLLHGITQQELAEKLKISQPGVHKRLVVYGNINSIQAFINRYRELLKAK